MRPPGLVLAEQGVAALSVRAVAAVAGVSPAQVQYYHRTKADLLRAAYDHAWAQFAADLEAAGATTLLDFVEQWLPLDERRERRARVWLAYAAISAVDEELARATARADDELRKWYRGRGLTDEEAAQLFALVDGVTVQCLVLPQADRSALVDRTVRTFVSGLTIDGSDPQRQRGPVDVHGVLAAMSSARRRTKGSAWL